MAVASEQLILATDYEYTLACTPAIRPPMRLAGPSAYGSWPHQGMGSPAPGSLHPGLRAGRVRPRGQPGRVRRRLVLQLKAIAASPPPVGGPAGPSGGRDARRIDLAGLSPAPRLEALYVPRGALARSADDQHPLRAIEDPQLESHREGRARTQHPRVF